MGLFSRLQSFSYVQARRFARHPDRSYRSAKAPGSRGFYVHAYLGLLPPRAVDMLTVRFGQLTVRGLSPHKIRSLVGCSPNVQAQQRRTRPKGAFGVRWSAWLCGAAPSSIVRFRPWGTFRSLLIRVAVLGLRLRRVSPAIVVLNRPVTLG